MTAGLYPWQLLAHALLSSLHCCKKKKKNMNVHQHTAGTSFSSFQLNFVKHFAKEVKAGRQEIDLMAGLRKTAQAQAL